MVDEKLKVTIEEEDEIEEGRVKDFGFTLNTGQSGSAEFISPPINGELEAVMMSSDKRVQVEIALDEFRDIVLLGDIDFFGRKYLPLRTEPVDNSNLVFKNEAVKWVLNNRLYVKVKGPVNTTVNFILRWC